VAGGRFLARFTALAVALAVVTGCGITHLQDLQFRVDKRLHFTSPADRALVHQPLTVSWTMDDFTVEPQGSAPASRDAGYFAVFVDRSPVKPGHTMKDVASGDNYCKQSPSCPDRSYLRQHQVYTTTSTHVRLGLIPALANDHEDVQLHTVTVVLMDTAGHRIGESAWELDLRIRKVGL
jgi:hypothetical protein